MQRRNFIRSAALGASAVLGLPGLRSFAALSTNWPIGCFNRAWAQLSLDNALDGIASAGYKVIGLLSGHRSEAMTSSSATPEYVDALKKRIAERGLSVNMTALRFRLGTSVEENFADVGRQIGRRKTRDLAAQFVGARTRR